MCFGTVNFTPIATTANSDLLVGSKSAPLINDTTADAWMKDSLSTLDELA